MVGRCMVGRSWFFSPVMWCCLVLIRLLFWIQQQRCSITSIVKIITTLWRSKVTSNRFPNLQVWKSQTHHTNNLVILNDILKDGSLCKPCSKTNQKRIRRMLETRRTRQTRVEKPSVFLVLWIWWYWGAYGTALPNTITQEATQPRKSHRLPPSSSPTCPLSISWGQKSYGTALI